MNEGLKNQLESATQVELTPIGSTWMQKSRQLHRVVQLESTRGCKHPPIDSGLLPSGALATHPIEKYFATSSNTIYVNIKYGFDILRSINTLRGDIRNAWVSTQVFEFPRHSGATDMGIPYKVPIIAIPGAVKSKARETHNTISSQSPRSLARESRKAQRRKVQHRVD
jgi:hypothetical protein